MYKLNQAFLLFPTFFFCIGLIFGVFLNPISFAIGFTVLCCSVLFIAFKTVSVRFHLVFASVMYLMGMIYMQSLFPFQNQMLESGNEDYFIARIDEQLKKGEKWESNIVTVEFLLENEEWKESNEKILLLNETSSRLMQSGDRILIKSKISRIQNKGNPGEFNAENYWISKGVRYQCFGFLENIQLIDVAEKGYFPVVLENVRGYSNSIISKFVPEKSQGLVSAILMGDKSSLDIDTKNAFANAGAIHVLAVSGLHVGIIAYLLNAIFKFLFKGRFRTLAIVLLLIILWFYAFITGFSPSVTRAVLMFSILIGAQLFSKNYSSLNSLALAALILLVWNPLYLFDPGFQLSFLAMLGIFLVYGKLESLIYVRNTILKKAWQGTVVGLSAQVFTIPLSLYLFHQFPNYFILSNLGVMVLSNLILGCGIALIIFGKIPLLNIFIGWCLGLSVLALIIVIDWVQHLPGSVALGFQPSFTWTLVLYVLILGFISLKNQKTKLISIVMIIPMIIGLQYDRYANLSQIEVCVFNTNHPTVLLNHSGNQICLYSGEEDGFLDAQQLVSNYQRIYPGTIQFIEVDQKQIELVNTTDSISVERSRLYMDVTLNKKQFRVITSARYWVKQNEMINQSLICAPYLGDQEGIVHHLKNGAFQFYMSTF